MIRRETHFVSLLSRFTLCFYIFLVRILNPMAWNCHASFCSILYPFFHFYSPCISFSRSKRTVQFRTWFKTKRSRNWCLFILGYSAIRYYHPIVIFISYVIRKVNFFMKKIQHLKEIINTEKYSKCNLVLNAIFNIFYFNKNGCIFLTAESILIVFSPNQISSCIYFE